jgi:hypothetical protein
MKSKLDYFQSFDEWWAKLSPKTRATTSIETARMAFVAGCRVGARPTNQTYRYQAGRWKVTVEAVSVGDAKLAAVRKLNERAAKLGATPPEKGWRLTPLYE